MEHIELIAGKKHAPERLGSVLVLGLGKSGVAVAEYLASLVGSRVDKLVIAGGVENESARTFSDGLLSDIADRGFEGAAEVYFDCETIEGRFDVCIASPGISPFSDFYQNAQKVSSEVMSEIEFAWRESAKQSTWIAVTGTNGKTTTTALAAHVLSSCAFDVRAVGNIGDVALAAAVGPNPPDVFVVEVSSFQLAGTRLFAPDAAIILNITPDHLSWHKTHEHYVASKFKVLENLQMTGGPAILDISDELLCEKSCALASIPAEERGYPIIPIFSELDRTEGRETYCNAAWVDKGVLQVDYAGLSSKLCDVGELRIKGPHNVVNALAAASAALAVGAKAQHVAAALATFEPLVHRIEPCGTVNGVECFNDSKATNVDAVLKAVGAFPKGTIVLLLGGRDKGTDLSSLVDAAKRCAKAVVCFGESRARFLEAFCPIKPAVAVIEAGSMENALDEGLRVAAPGDVVLLSPACASFDEFSCYQERGDVFKKLVACRGAQGKGGSRA